MKASSAFKKAIKTHLDKLAAEDELFAVTYKKENKNLDECCNYVMKCAKDGGSAGYSDDEVFGWAVHYYDEDDINDIKPVNGKVIINQSVELTEEEKEQAKAKAIERFIEEEKDKVKLDYKVELSDEDKAQAREKAIELAVEEAKTKMLQKKKAKAKAIATPAGVEGDAPEAKKEEEKVQGSLF
ncbi:Cas9 inhibitor AcrIIA9 family protein [Flavobacterium sp. 102]|uniref:PcfK-like family protein n=1 Tax=Flavobacterium sp. 102 TaxID=2135623 RepID=UPI000EB3A4B1|nr:Cas9 inhibitor AcrIIA9 family protein [Flavobacterium sp. 102]RKS00445.1 PcfK-like protein [Flavobacterium sp. 102]